MERTGSWLGRDSKDSGTLVKAVLVAITGLGGFHWLAMERNGSAMLLCVLGSIDKEEAVCGDDKMSMREPG